MRHFLVICVILCWSVQHTFANYVLGQSPLDLCTKRVVRQVSKCSVEFAREIHDRDENPLTPHCCLWSQLIDCIETDADHYCGQTPTMLAHTMIGPNVNVTSCRYERTDSFECQWYLHKTVLILILSIIGLLLAAILVHYFCIGCQALFKTICCGCCSKEDDLTTPFVRKVENPKIIRERSLKRKSLVDKYSKKLPV